MTIKLKTPLLNHLRKNEILVPHLVNYFTNGEFPDNIPFNVHMNKEQDDAFHPSSATKCAKEAYAERVGDLTHNPPTSEQQLNFMFGHAFHYIVQWTVVEGLKFATWDDVEKEHDERLVTPAGNPYRIRGFIDIERCVIPNKGTYLIDIKTMNGRLFQQDNLPASTFERYEAQVRMYLSMSGLEQAIILCVSKDSPHRFKEVLIQADPYHVDEVIDRWETVADSLASRTPPRCTCDDPSKCRVRDYYQAA